MKLTRDAFCDLRNEAQRALRRSKETPSVLICAGTGCIAGGAMKIYETSGPSAKAGICRCTSASSTTPTRKRACTSR